MSEEDTQFHPISYIAGETGVNPVTLRAWERRYGLIVPKRTPKGHRLYSQDDVMLVKQILFLLSKGYAISKVKPLLKKSFTEVNEIGVNPEFKQHFEPIAKALANLSHEHLNNALAELYTIYSPEQYAGIIHPSLMAFLNIEVWPYVDNAITQKTFLYDTLHAMLYHYLYSHMHKNNKNGYFLIGYKTNEAQSMTVHGLMIANILKAYEHRVDFISDVMSEDELINLATQHLNTTIIVFSNTELFFLNNLNSKIKKRNLTNVVFSLPIAQKEALTSRASILPTNFAEIYGYLNRLE